MGLKHLTEYQLIIFLLGLKNKVILQRKLLALKKWKLAMARDKFTAHICYACHLVRGCPRCCAVCHGCNMRHDCELQGERKMTEAEGWEWFLSCAEVFDLEYMKPFVPEAIRRKVEERMGKGVEQTLKFYY